MEEEKNAPGESTADPQEKTTRGLNKRERKIQRQEQQRKSTRQRTSRSRSGNQRGRDVDHGEAAIAASLKELKMVQELEEQELMKAVLLSTSQSLEMAGGDSELEEEKLLSQAIEMSLSSSGTNGHTASNPHPVKSTKVAKRKGRKHKRRRKKYDEDGDDEYVPQAEKGNSFRARGEPQVDCPDHEDAALAAALNLSLLENDPSLPAGYVHATEKATRKYRKQRKPSSPLPKSRPRQEEEWRADNASLNNIGSDELEEIRLLRQQQDLEFQAALLADQEKERLNEEIERSAEDKKRKEEERRAKLIEAKSALPEEPSEGVPSCVTCLLQLPIGVRVARRFTLQEPFSTLHTFVQCLGLEYNMPEKWRIVADFPQRNTELGKECFPKSLASLGFSTRDLLRVVAFED